MNGTDGPPAASTASMPASWITSAQTAPYLAHTVRVWLEAIERVIHEVLQKAALTCIGQVGILFLDGLQHINRVLQTLVPLMQQLLLVPAFKSVATFHRDFRHWVGSTLSEHGNRVRKEARCSQAKENQPHLGGQNRNACKKK